MIQTYTGTILIPAAATAVDLYLESIITGRIQAIYIDIGDLTDPVIAFTGETTGVPILTEAATGWYYPRAFANQVADGTAEAVAREEIHVLKERIKVAVSHAVAGETGTVTVYVDTPNHPY